MPSRIRSSPYWHISPRLPGRGRMNRISTRTRDRHLAVRMEALLVTIARRAQLEPEWWVLIDALQARPRRLTLFDLVKADAAGMLEALRDQLIEENDAS